MVKKSGSVLRGFSLVEILIVEAIIAIIAVAVMGVIDPTEKYHRAADAVSKNDAAEVLNAYQRYSITRQSFPWMDVDDWATINSMDTAWFGRSDQSGAGLCGLVGASPPNSQCDNYAAYPGLLIASNELKTAFLGKGYTSITEGDPKYDVNEMNYLWVDKKWVAAAQLDAIYVCYIPKAKSDRLKTANLKKPILIFYPHGNPHKPPNTNPGKGKNKNRWGVDVEIVGLTATEDADFSGDRPAAIWDFKTPETSLFKCVP